jgi:hypothetical protein
MNNCLFSLVIFHTFFFHFISPLFLDTKLWLNMLLLCKKYPVMCRNWFTQVQPNYSVWKSCLQCATESFPAHWDAIQLVHHLGLQHWLPCNSEKYADNNWQFTFEHVNYSYIVDSTSLEVSTNHHHIHWVSNLSHVTHSFAICLMFITYH